GRARRWTPLPRGAAAPRARHRSRRPRDGSVRPRGRREREPRVLLVVVLRRSRPDPRGVFGHTGRRRRRKRRRLLLRLRLRPPPQREPRAAREPTGRLGRPSARIVCGGASRLGRESTAARAPRSRPRRGPALWAHRARSGRQWPRAARRHRSFMKLVVFGLTVSSSWGNGHATLWRGLCRALARRRHTVVFFERDVPYYRSARDLFELQ